MGVGVGCDCMMGNGQALKKQKEQEEKLEIEKTKRAKDQDKIHRDRIKAKLEQVSLILLLSTPCLPYIAIVHTCHTLPVTTRSSCLCSVSRALGNSLAQDRLERLAAKGIKPQEGGGGAKADKPVSITKNILRTLSRLLPFPHKTPSS